MGVQTSLSALTQTVNKTIQHFFQDINTITYTVSLSWLTDACSHKDYHCYLKKLTNLIVEIYEKSILILSEENVCSAQGNIDFLLHLLIFWKVSLAQVDEQMCLHCNTGFESSDYTS